jgi:hypothetical protein
VAEHLRRLEDLPLDTSPGQQLMRSSHHLGLVLVTASAVAWSTAGFFSRLIALDAATMLVWRGLFGAVAIGLVAFAMGRGKLWRSVKAMGWLGWLYAIVSGSASRPNLSTEELRHFAKSFRDVPRRAPKSAKGRRPSSSRARRSTMRGWRGRPSSDMGGGSSGSRQPWRINPASL